MRVNRLAILATGIVLLASWAAGSAPPGKTAASLCAAHPSTIGPASRPFSPSQQLPVLEQARSRIGFEPHLPAGRPFRIYVSRDVELRHRQLGLAYRQSSEKWFLLTEQPSTSSRVRFDQFVRDMSARDECGNATTVRLRNGSLALLVDSRDRRVLRFRTAGIDILLLASPSSASSLRLIALANAITV